MATGSSTLNSLIYKKAIFFIFSLCIFIFPELTMVIMASGPRLHQPAINFMEMPSPSAPIVNSQHHSTGTIGSHHTNTTGCLSCAPALCSPATGLFPDHDEWTRTPFREAAWLSGAHTFPLENGEKNISHQTDCHCVLHSPAQGQQHVPLPAPCLPGSSQLSLVPSIFPWEKQKY